MLLNLLRSQL